ncbi:MAG: putative ATP-dependent endonuclease of OLD family [Urechidicola sp.]|jgi:putative ATP-dependent endonuclease of OLD family
MKIQKIKIHNFRSVENTEFNVDDYSLLIGENNAGKTTIITAIRMFYEDKGLKFIERRDFPKFQVEDNESWVEILYKTTDEEQENLKEEYKSDDNLLKIRKYFKSSEKTYKGNLYAYENGNLTHENQFYGSTNVGKSKIGKILYIPALSKTDEGLKMSGPSPLRDMVNFVFEKIVENSESFKNLSSAFEAFNTEISKVETTDGFSIDSLTDDINSEINQFGLGFGLGVNTIKPNDIVRTLISHSFKDSNLESDIDDVNALGQGVQRHLIYTLIKLSLKYSETKKAKKKDFSPEFTIILFEEPEAFLHPSQQEQLNISLRTLSKEDNQQILITSHSPTFTSKNIQEIKNIIRINKTLGKSETFQLNNNSLNTLLNNNVGLYTHFCNILQDPNETDTLKNKIRGKYGDDIPDEANKLIEEALKYFLWLNSERSSMFFAKHVLICEGASEKIFIDYLLNENWHDLKKKHLYCLDALGKFNIHRYMNLLGCLGIEHSIIMDKDQDKDVQKQVNEFINDKKNTFTKNIHSFEIDFEDFLEISKPHNNRSDLKPMNIMFRFKNNEISQSRIDELKTIIENLIKE